MRKWHPHFTRAPLAPTTALAQVKCREHARPCQTRVINAWESSASSTGCPGTAASPYAGARGRHGLREVGATRSDYFDKV